MSSKFPGSELWEVDPSGVGAENRVVRASREDHASGDSCSSARRPPAAAWEAGQGQAGRAQPPQAPSLRWQIQTVGAGGLISRFRAVLMVSLVNAEQMGEGTPAPLGTVVGPNMYACAEDTGPASQMVQCGSCAHEHSLTHHGVHKGDFVGQTDRG